MTSSAAVARRPRLLGPFDLALCAALTWLPLLLGAHGRLNADTKQYLYLDPGRLLDRARSIWDPAVGGGTVTHQTIGYLWPMGPYYWLTDAIGLPSWAAQRIWIGGTQFLAALGALVLFRHLMPRHPLQVVAAIGYGLSPFLLGHEMGQSALLLPFAAFGWLVWCIVRAVETGSWRWPAAFALIVTSCGSLNGSSVFFVLLGAVLWVPYAVWWRGDATMRAGLAVLARAGVLVLVTQLWWLVAYAVDGRYGLPILSLTETVRGTSETTNAAEIVRGLGYWFFYGRDAHQAWLQDIAVPYLESGALITITFLVPFFALALGAIVRWGPRAYFAALAGLGTIIAVGAFPNPQSIVGRLFERASVHSDLVLSLRNTQRAGPLVVLGFMGLAAGGLTALTRDHQRIAVAVGVMFAVLIAAALPAQWRTGLIASRFHRDDIPAAWREAGAYLDQGSGRVLELPGIDFASYRWGHTLDPVSVGLTKRPILAREFTPMGGAPGASLLDALDRTIQEGRFEPASLVPVARLLGITDVLARNDLEYERYRTVRPPRLWSWLTDPRAGLGLPQEFGSRSANRAAAINPLIDEIELGLDPHAPPPPQVAVLPVPGAKNGALFALPVGGGVVIDGDGDGVVAAAAAHLLDQTDGPLLLGADVAKSADQFAESTGPATRFVITDTNRKRAFRWFGLVDEPAASSQSVVYWQGAARVAASSYGNIRTPVPEDRPVNAFDGDVSTAWRTDIGDFFRADVQLDIGHPVDADHVTLIQPQGRPGTRPITRARIVLDGTRNIDVTLAPDDARDPEGTRVALDGRPFQTIDVEVLAVDGDPGPAGFAEIAIPGVNVAEVVDLPHAVLDKLGARTSDAPLAFVFTRLRADSAEPVRADTETALRRSFTLPAPVRVRLGGTARVRANAPDADVDALLGLPGADSGGVTAQSSEHLAGSIESRAAGALDGNPNTSWSTPFVGVVGQWWQVDTGHPRRIESLSFDVVADQHHSVPTRVSVSVDGGDPETVDLPHVARGDVLGATQRIDVPLSQPLSGRTLRVTIDAIDARTTPDWYSLSDLTMPVALAEVRVPGLAPRPVPSALDTGCRNDLLAIDGRPVGIRVGGSHAAALDGSGLDVKTCDGESLALAAGPHELRTAPGVATALDLDRLVLTTPAWDTRVAPLATPTVAVRHTSATTASGQVTTDGTPFWLVLDQSINKGWKLKVAGAHVDGPRPVNSYANGWLVKPNGPGTLSVTARFAPQRAVNVALAMSGLGVIICLALIVFDRRRRDDLEPIAPPELADRILTRGRGLIVPLGAAAVTALAVRPLAAPVALVLVAVARRWPRAGRFLPAALLAATAVQVVALQIAHRYTTDRIWPGKFPGAHVTAMLAVITLATTALAEARERSSAQERATAQPLRDIPLRR